MVTGVFDTATGLFSGSPFGQPASTPAVVTVS